MEELDLSSHMVRIFQHDYRVRTKKQMIKKVVCEALIRHTRSRRDWNPGDHDVIVDRVDDRNFRCSLRLFTQQQIRNCSRILLSLYQNA